MPTGISAYALIAALLLGGGAAGGAWLEHKFDAGRYNALQASVEAAHAKALEAAMERQKALDAAAIAAADQETQAQAALAIQAKRQLAEVKKHAQVVHIASKCVPYGFVRVLDAAAFGISAERLPLPAGKSDAACAPIGWNALASAIIRNLGIARANSEQLNALEHFNRTVR